MTNELELLITGRQFRKMCEKEYETIRKKYDLRKIELDILYFLECTKEAQTARDIARIKQISKAHISSAVEKLVEKSMLETREDTADRRRIILQVTRAGKAVVKELVLIRQRMSQIVYKGITEEEQRVMQQVAEKMLKNMQEEMESAGKEI